MQKLEVAMEQSINLREYLDILKRRRIIVILVMIICLGLGGYKTYVNYESYVPTYRSSVTVRINSTKNVKKKKNGFLRRNFHSTSTEDGALHAEEKQTKDDLNNK